MSTFTIWEYIKAQKQIDEDLGLLHMLKRQHLVLGLDMLSHIMRKASPY